MNLRDRDNLRAKDKRPTPKVSFVRRLDCNLIIFAYNLYECLTIVILYLYFFHSTGHYNECVAAHNSVPPDPTMTVDNVTQMLNKIPADKWEEVMGGGELDIPGPLLEEIQRRYFTDTEKNHTCADYYANCHPDAEWRHLTVALYGIKEFSLARESKSFMSTGK